MKARQGDHVRRRCHGVRAPKMACNRSWSKKRCVREGRRICEADSGQTVEREEGSLSSHDVDGSHEEALIGSSSGQG